MPTAKAATSLPRSACLYFPVRTPSLASSIMPVVSISVWSPRSFLVLRASATALGMLPMPSWMQDASGTMSAMNLPMARSRSPRGGLMSSGTG